MEELRWYYKNYTVYETYLVLYRDDKFILVQNVKTRKYSFGLVRDFGTLCGFPVNQSCLDFDKLKETLDIFIGISRKNNSYERLKVWEEMLVAVGT